MTYDVDWEHCNRCAAIQAEQAHQANEAKHRATPGNDGARIVVKEVWPDG